jgi:hypothetical protein
MTGPPMADGLISNRADDMTAAPHGRRPGFLHAKAGLAVANGRRRNNRPGR